MKAGMLLVVVAILAPLSVSAAVPEHYTNANLFVSEHDKPVSLFFDGAGGFYGYTEHGFYYTQRPVVNAYGIRLHRFTIDRATFFTSDRGIIRARSDLAALSIYFARA